MSKKIIKLTESDLKSIIERVITEQKKFPLVVNQGSNAEANLKGNVVTITTESGQVQKFIVKTSLPQGRFMFEHGKDGKYYGYDKNRRKVEIKLLEKI
jgi:hypothetical protein